MNFKRLCKTLISFEASPGDLRIIDVLIVGLVMQQGSLTHKAIGAETGLSNASVSRTVTRLSTVNRNGKPGYGLLETIKDPREGRRHLVQLTRVARGLLK
jgi:DNA-binding MarR family transcriptional regulator